MYIILQYEISALPVLMNEYCNGADEMCFYRLSVISTLKYHPNHRSTGNNIWYPDQSIMLILRVVGAVTRGWLGIVDWAKSFRRA
jgi:hypothetical protein